VLLALTRRNGELSELWAGILEVSGFMKPKGLEQFDLNNVAC
jgi:hypothetical protein